MTAESRCGSTSQVGCKTETQPCIANHLRTQLFIHNFSKISLQLFTHKLFKIFLHMFINKLSKICKGGKGRTQHCTTSHPPGLFTHKRLKREEEEAGGTVLSPPLASFANLGEFVDEHVEKNLEKLVDEQLSSQVVGNTRLCLRLAANLTR